MTANELMIGDWVYGIFSGCPQERITMKYSICSNSYEWNYIPIPLTPEILEKNGFFNDGVSFWYLDFRIVLSTSKGVSLVCGRQKRFEYVHELQHALRLAGIDKEIEL